MGQTGHVCRMVAIHLGRCPAKVLYAYCFDLPTNVYLYCMEFRQAKSVCDSLDVEGNLDDPS